MGTAQLAGPVSHPPASTMKVAITRVIVTFKGVGVEGEHKVVRPERKGGCAPVRRAARLPCEICTEFRCRTSPTDQIETREIFDLIETRSNTPEEG